MAATHFCPIAGCPQEVPDRYVMCWGHWSRVSPRLRAEIWSLYRRQPGSRPHQEAITRAIRQVEEQLGRSPRPH